MKKKNTLTGKILLGLFLGFIFGLFLKQMPSNYIKDTVILGGVLKVLGNGFTSAIKMMVVPLVFVSLICGTASMGDVKKLGRIGGKTMLFYLSTTAIAIITALFLGIVFKPGVGLDMSNMMSGEVTIGESKSLVDIILNIIPTNPIQSLANGEMLQVIFFALLTGVALNIVGKKAEPIKVIFESANEVCMKMVNLIMLFAPYGVFALVANTFATVGSEAIIALLKYILIVLLGMIIHITIVYGGLFKIFTKLSIKPFLSKFAQVAAVTFSTASSNASVPVRSRKNYKIIYNSNGSYYQYGRNSYNARCCSIIYSSDIWYRTWSKLYDNNSSYCYISIYRNCRSSRSRYDNVIYGAYICRTSSRRNWFNYGS